MKGKIYFKPMDELVLIRHGLFAKITTMKEMTQVYGLSGDESVKELEHGWFVVEVNV